MKIITPIASILCVTALFMQPSHAAVTDYQTATWNMQGSSQASEAKWNVNVQQLVSGDASVDILALQEAGTVPATARVTGRQIVSPLPSVPVREYEWNLGTRSRPNIRYIYFAEWDAGARRVNQAIVTRSRADEIVILPNPLVNSARPLLGVGFNRTGGVRGRDYFFTIHGFATGGGDTAPSIEAIHGIFEARRDSDSQWLVMGDYNTNPNVLLGNLQRRLIIPITDVEILTQPSPTQRSGGTLDYAVFGQYNAAQSVAILLAAAMFVAQLHGSLNSDHTPVKFFRKS
ncbi:cytolethal distending toxin subunit B family protein [Paraburkholderia sp. UYCP14C]|uniref:cytolethal distending toxin subunit B family protein n=1 Tax=Paraburkholderia sp. UYCP14C TaxID=2511130 RepID=UPI00101ECE93|nr:cytolethal distending toxin subunit B family protein [Paraburkholderia sp. UYCP14C]RZF23483.1 cytolethal distending toxin subunit B family protein [Paraburkholderia sp. UYCP14C]